MNDTGVESELKIPIADLAAVREGLRRAHATEVQPMSREINLLFDTDDRRLEAAGCVLRLRSHGDHRRVTFKGPVSYRGAVKQRPEHETEVGDLDRLQEIFELLGFTVTARYEKDREEWRLDDVWIALDHTPMGDFVEVEGPPTRLRAAARALGLDAGRGVRGSYISLWREFRTVHTASNLPTDMVFEK
jgi:adenylate cyclase, class 2